MRVDEFEFELPRELIAQQPPAQRDGSRLLVLDRQTGRYYHENFPAILKYLRAGDCLVVNDTKVLKARLLGKRTQTGGRWEGLFVGESDAGWEFLTKTRGKVSPGEQIAVDGSDVLLEMRSRTATGSWLAAPVGSGVVPFDLLQSVGHVPLPPYIRDGRDMPHDLERYQTIYADRLGSIAAPTAGLHFTPELVEQIRQAGVRMERVTLHVGVGTFLPVKCEVVEEHAMHAEWCEVSAAVAESLNEVRGNGGRIIAVGTTTVRVLESAASTSLNAAESTSETLSEKESGVFRAFSGPTSLFITPGWHFRGVDALLTNFHLPRSTLLMLTAAFGEKEGVLRAYAEAVRRKYRFFSYGDAMLIVDG